MGIRLQTRLTGRVVRSQDVNQLVTAFDEEHYGTDAAESGGHNFHRKYINLGLNDANDNRGVVAHLLGEDKILEFDVTSNTWGQRLGAGDFTPFLKELENDILVYADDDGLPNGIPVSDLDDPRFGLTLPFLVAGGLTTPVQFRLGRRRSMGDPDEVLVSGLLGIGDMATRIDRDGLGNMTFTDALSGTFRLAQLAQGPADRFFSPEFDDAVVYDPLGNIALGASAFTSSYDPSEFHNYYKWFCDQGSDKTVSVVLRVKLPDVFQGWSNIRVYLKTASNGHLAVTLSGTNNSAVTLTGATGLVSIGGWSQFTITVGAGTFTPGEYVTVTFNLIARSSASVWLGEVELNYA